MKEIIFRGKTEQGEWVYGFYVEAGFNTYISNQADNCRIEASWEKGAEIICEKVIPSTIGQYTGLTDDKNAKIFEGDILYLADQGNEIQAVVEFGNPNGFYSWGWQLRQIKGENINLDILCWVNTECPGVRCEIIGNIHESEVGE